MRFLIKVSVLSMIVFGAITYISDRVGNGNTALKMIKNFNIENVN